MIPALSGRVETGLALGNAGVAVPGGHLVVPLVAPVGAQSRQLNNMRSKFSFGASGLKRDAVKLLSVQVDADAPVPGALRSNGLDESSATHAELLLPRVAGSSHVADGDAADLLNAADGARPPVPNSPRSSNLDLCWSQCTQ